jgi:hypothetical protein
MFDVCITEKSQAFLRAKTSKANKANRSYFFFDWIIIFRHNCATTSTL